MLNSPILFIYNFNEGRNMAIVLKSSLYTKLVMSTQSTLWSSTSFMQYGNYGTLPLVLFHKIGLQHANIEWKSITTLDHKTCDER